MLWYSGKLACPSLSALGVNGEPTKTHSRHMEFGGKIISPEALYWGKYRDLVSALGFVGDCANIAVPAVAQAAKAIAVARVLRDIWPLPPTLPCRAL